MSSPYGSLEDLIQPLRNDPERSGSSFSGWMSSSREPFGEATALSMKT